jgi:hypothetical protein
LVEQLTRHTRRERSLPLPHPSQLLEEVIRLKVFEEIPICAVLHRGSQIMLIVGDSEHDHFYSRHLGLDPTGGLQAIAIRHGDVHKDHIWPQFPCFLDGLETILRLSDNVEIWLDIEKSNQAFPEEQMIVN